jgi:hypothetical protein
VSLQTTSSIPQLYNTSFASAAAAAAAAAPPPLVTATLLQATPSEIHETLEIPPNLPTPSQTQSKNPIKNKQINKILVKYGKALHETYTRRSTGSDRFLFFRRFSCQLPFPPPPPSHFLSPSSSLGFTKR